MRLVPSVKAIDRINGQEYASRQQECNVCGAEKKAEIRPDSRAAYGCSNCDRNSATLSRIESPLKSSTGGRLNKKLVDWAQLSDRIEDWFHYAGSTGIWVFFATWTCIRN